jgi:hypothetical protein
LEQWEEDKDETSGEDDLAKIEREQRETEKRLIKQYAETEDDESEETIDSDTEDSEKEIDLLVE